MTRAAASPFFSSRKSGEGEVGVAGLDHRGHAVILVLRCAKEGIEG